MIRIVSVAVFAALAAALFLVPGVSPARLATKQIGELVHEEADRLTAAGDPVTDASGEPVRAPLWEILVEAGQTGQPDPDAEAHPALKIGGARFVVDEEVLQEGEVRDINWSLEAVRSIQRELRAVIAEEGILSASTPTRSLTRTGSTSSSASRRTRSCCASSARSAHREVERPWSPITPRSLCPPRRDLPGDPARAAGDRTLRRVSGRAPRS